MCKSKAIHENRICVGCGREFTTRNSRSHFCCRKCYKNWQNKVDVDIMRKGNNHTTAKGIQDRLDEKGLDFEYIGGWTHTDGRLMLRCKKCGHKFEHSASFTKPSSNKKVRCPECYKAHKDKLLEAKAEAKEMKIRKKADEKEFKIFERNSLQAEIQICPICNGIYVGKTGKMYCSSKCQQKQSDRRKELARRTRIAGQMVDKDITLEMVYEKDNGNCYICGNKCNFNDYKIVNGAFIVGSSYPTIEHIIPLSKGGEHSWNNVRCACHMCNSIKGTKVYGR